MTKENVLKRANDVVSKRGQVYGTPLDDFRRTAKIWSGILGIDVRPEQVALCMMGVKMSRLSQTPDHDDSNLDIAGYSWCYEQCINGEKDENQIELDFNIDDTNLALQGAGVTAKEAREIIRERDRCGYCGIRNHTSDECPIQESHRHFSNPAHIDN